MDQSMCTPLFPHPLSLVLYVAGMDYDCYVIQKVSGVALLMVCMYINGIIIGRHNM